MLIMIITFGDNNTVIITVLIFTFLILFSTCYCHYVYANNPSFVLHGGVMHVTDVSDDKASEAVLIGAVTGSVLSMVAIAAIIIGVVVCKKYQLVILCIERKGDDNSGHEDRTGPESPEHLGLSIYESVDPKEATYSEIDRNQARSATESPEHLGLPIYESLKSKAKDATYTDLVLHLIAHNRNKRRLFCELI
ncbi:uncharacterized protein LOC128233644 isoform X2 [Mya arenaria]|uniref:uncharacterized protein LOC128233644 isoform X2 n=1 Tax=Mya arenaria TaxID=6604 RepID=UPI0022E52A0D|nr:uncharacterized protein LOC128233644 isoform X2 [Mya arenaria]XP_052803384.1 uncharacterized protein LOC128233644 isoform X2 [Mya arenaria]